MAKQTTTPQVDENFMKEVIAQGFPMKRELTPEKTSEDKNPQELMVNVDTTSISDKTKCKRDASCDYVERYFERVDFSNRQLINITRDTHSKLNAIAEMIGGKNSTVGSYMENIIREHFETHKEVINTIYASRFKKPL